MLGLHDDIYNKQTDVYGNFDKNKQFFLLLPFHYFQSSIRFFNRLTISLSFSILKANPSKREEISPKLLQKRNQKEKKPYFNRSTSISLLLNSNFNPSMTCSERFKSLVVFLSSSFNFSSSKLTNRSNKFKSID